MIVEQVVGSIFLVVATFGLLFTFWRVTRCVHAWELVDKTELPSGFENMANAGVHSGYLSPFDYPNMAKKTVILALRCGKCGAAKIYRESA
jgi:hypothetical protein